jgi:hypothetical protein
VQSKEMLENSRAGNHPGSAKSQQQHCETSERSDASAREKLGFAKGGGHPANATAYGKAPASRTGGMPLIGFDYLAITSAYATEPK